MTIMPSTTKRFPIDVYATKTNGPSIRFLEQTDCFLALSSEFKYGFVGFQEFPPAKGDLAIDDGYYLKRTFIFTDVCVKKVELGKLKMFYARGKLMEIIKKPEIGNNQWGYD